MATLDFSQLYSQLNLQPDCSLEDFKRAYRRRVAELHPDKHAADAVPANLKQMSLSELISLYGMAMQFHKRHGRLPGGAAKASHSFPLDTALRRSIAVDVPRQGSAGISYRSWLAVAILLALVVYLLVSEAPLPSSPPEETSVRAAITSPGAHSRANQLQLGMDMSTALAIQGTPSHRREKVWEYGPSWLRFENGRLVDWYSSPLYRLRTPTPEAPTTMPDE